MFLALIVLVLAVAVFAGFYLVRMLRKLSFLDRLPKKWLSWLAASLILAAFAVTLSLVLSPINMLICLLHLAAFRLLWDGIGWILRKWTKWKCGYDGKALGALVLTVVYLGLGWYSAHHVAQTQYQFQSSKVSQPLRIVQFSDSHIGVTFDAEGFAAQLEQINARDPDIVVITGDFVDDNTSRQDMLGACKALEGLRTSYGVYFVYGNHDKGYYSAGSRGWSAKELEEALEESGVVILEDEAVALPGGYTLIGRQDASHRQRASMEALMDLAEPGSYSIILDHQPTDYPAQAAAGADLVLSGHTHGGQMLPVTYVGQWFGLNCRTYGHERRDSTDFIVSSGIASWELRFKTGCISEFVVIDLVPTV